MRSLRTIEPLFRISSVRSGLVSEPNRTRQNQNRPNQTEPDSVKNSFRLGLNWSDLVRPSGLVVRNECITSTAHELKELTSFMILRSNFLKVANLSREYLELSIDELVEIIQDDELDITSESHLFLVLMRWVEHDAVARRKVKSPPFAQWLKIFLDLFR